MTGFYLALICMVTGQLCYMAFRPHGSRVWLWPLNGGWSKLAWRLWRPSACWLVQLRASRIFYVLHNWSSGGLLPKPSIYPCPFLLISSILEQLCQHYLVHGLAASTCKSYFSGQTKFIEFCGQRGKLHPNGSPCPIDKWTLCLFASFMAFRGFS